jgi:hypothetical protein
MLYFNYLKVFMYLNFIYNFKTIIQVNCNYFIDLILLNKQAVLSFFLKDFYHILFKFFNLN